MEEPVRYRIVKNNKGKWDVVSKNSGRRMARDKARIDAEYICSQKNARPYKHDYYWENYE